jgi:hypothetical protein
MLCVQWVVNLEQPWLQRRLGIQYLSGPLCRGDNPSDGDFATVVRKKRVTQSPVGTAAAANTTKKTQNCYDWSEKLFLSLCCTEESPQEVTFCLLVFPRCNSI